VTPTESYFKDHIIEAGVLDPEGVHHEFVSGMHGRKLDFDTIETGTPLYQEWIDVAASYIEREFPELPQVIMGVANGTNRVAQDTAARFNDEIFGLVSAKDEQKSKKLYLPPETEDVISDIKPELVVVLEDVGTTGSNSVQVALQSLGAGAKEVEVVATWQRRPHLEKLEEAGIAYRAIIKEVLPTYSPEGCQAEGFCAQGWEFISRYSM